MRRVILLFVWGIVLAAYGLVIRDVNPAFATQHQISCWTSGQGSGTCTGITDWYSDGTLYWSAGGAFNTYFDIYASANMRGTNYQYSGSAISQQTCSRSGFNGGCGTYYDALCLISVCGSGQSLWYATTYSYWANGTTYFDMYTASDTSHSRESYGCWQYMNCF